jgi:hypothetical protein
MGPYLELRANGFLGPEGATLLYATVDEVLRTDRVPPENGPRWTEEAVREVAHDFLSEEAGPRRLASLYLRSSDDDSLARLLREAVRAYLRDRARRRDVGPLRRRLVDVLGSAPQLVALDTPSGRAWTLPQHRDEAPYQGAIGPLIAAAWATPDIRIVRWRSARRRDPVADRPSLTAFAVAVLQAAEAPVLIGTLVEVAVRRFALAAPPLVVPLDDEPASDEPSAERVALTAITAGAIWDQLTQRERIMLALHDRSVREIGEEIGLAKSAAAAARNRLDELLTRALADDPDPEAVWNRLQELAAEDRTAGTGSSPTPS